MTDQRTMPGNRAELLRFVVDCTKPAVVHPRGFAVLSPIAYNEIGGYRGSVVANRNKAGRPRRAGDATTLIAVRLTPAEREIYEQEAAAAAQSLGEWIRTACESFMTVRHRRALHPRARS